MASTKEVKQNEMKLAWLNRERAKQGLPPHYVDFELEGNAAEMLPELQQEYLNLLRSQGAENMPMTPAGNMELTPEELMAYAYERQMGSMEGGAPGMGPMPGGQLPGMAPQQDPNQMAGGGMRPPMGEGDMSMGDLPEEQQQMQAAMVLSQHGIRPRPALIQHYLDYIGRVDPDKLWGTLKRMTELDDNVQERMKKENQKQFQ